MPSEDSATTDKSDTVPLFIVPKSLSVNQVIANEMSPTTVIENKNVSLVKLGLDALNTLAVMLYVSTF